MPSGHHMAGSNRWWMKYEWSANEATMRPQPRARLRTTTLDMPPLTSSVQLPYSDSMTASSTKTSRFEMRLTPEQRATMEQAAAARGINLRHWAIDNLMDAANRDIREAHTIYLSDEAYDEFVKALDDPMPQQIIDLLNEKDDWA